MGLHYSLSRYDAFVPALARKKAPEFLQTRTAEEVGMVLDRALNDCIPVIVRGVVGVGKTEILERYEYDQHFRIVTAVGGRHSEKVILQKVCEVHGIEPDRVGPRHCFDALIEAFTDTSSQTWGQPIVIDEAHFVEPDGFRSLLEIAATAGIPAIFFGNEDTARHKTTSKAQWSQIIDRIVIDKFIPGLHSIDFEVFADHYGVQGLDAVQYLQSSCAKQSLRGLKRVLEAAKSVTGEKKQIRLQELQEAVKICLSEKEDSGFFKISAKDHRTIVSKRNSAA